jgi:hypothetical protein
MPSTGAESTVENEVRKPSRLGQLAAAYGSFRNKICNRGLNGKRPSGKEIVRAYRRHNRISVRESTQSCLYLQGLFNPSFGQ